MRWASIIILGLLVTGCHHAKSGAEDPAVKADFEAQSADRAKEPDAKIILEPYNSVNDAAAANECRAVYGQLNAVTADGSSSKDIKHQTQLAGEIAQRRIHQMVDSQQNDRYRPSNVTLHAFVLRHDYRKRAQDPVQGPIILAELKNRAKDCDAAIKAWGAPAIDEAKVHDDLQKVWDKQSAGS